MDLRDLLYLAASATAGNFTRAAESLGIDASTVSRRVGRLEDELGLALFERGHTGIRLTPGGKAILPHIRRALAELNAIKHAGDQTGIGIVGEVRLGVQIPPVGGHVRNLLISWRDRNAQVSLTVFEMNETQIQSALRERRLDVALMMRHTLWPDAVTESLYRERLVAALPEDHSLADQPAVDWEMLRKETFLVHAWDGSPSVRELYASFMGSGVRFHTHDASKQSVMALVGAGFGVTLVTASQSEVTFPGVVYQAIRDKNAWVQIELVWSADAENPSVGRFVAFMRDEARSRGLLGSAYVAS
ncbi:MAG TPA: LysR substrate-binding domain-containing protein [Rhizomicrobium sp.]|jgi:DNA-binding transcriptional LysR family regulator|nr:LysR substrate-binding domain-containing protein [Rhizomicrobium sp.]